MGGERAPSQETAKEKNLRQPWAALEKMPALDHKAKENLVKNLIKGLEESSARDVLIGFAKTLEKTSIRTDWETFANNDRIRNFVIAMPKSLIIFLQKTLQKAGYNISFKQGKKVISGPRACDGDWGEASQTALMNFFRRYNEEKSLPIRTRNFQSQVASDQEKLLRLTQKWPTSSLPEGFFTKNGAIGDKGKTTLLLLAQGNNDIRGLKECQFGPQEENRAVILAAIKTIFGLIKEKRQYQAAHFSHGKITINGQTVSLWGDNPELIGLIGKENDQMRLVDTEEKKRFLQLEAKYLRKQYYPLSRKMFTLVRQTGLAIDTQEKIAEYLSTHIEHARSLVFHHEGYEKNTFDFTSVAHDEKGNRYESWSNLNEFKRASDEELERFRKKLGARGYLTPQLEGVIEEIKQQKNINYHRSKKTEEIRVPESYYQAVLAADKES